MCNTVRIACLVKWSVLRCLIIYFVFCSCGLWAETATGRTSSSDAEIRTAHVNGRMSNSGLQQKSNVSTLAAMASHSATLNVDSETTRTTVNDSATKRRDTTTMAVTADGIHVTSTASVHQHLSTPVSTTTDAYQVVPTRSHVTERIAVESERWSNASLAGLGFGLVTLLLLIYAVTWLLFACYHPDIRSESWLLQHWPMVKLRSARHTAVDSDHPEWRPSVDEEPQPSTSASAVHHSAASYV